MRRFFSGSAFSVVGWLAWTSPIMPNNRCAVDGCRLPDVFTRNHSTERFFIALPKSRPVKFALPTTQQSPGSTKRPQNVELEWDIKVLYSSPLTSRAPSVKHTRWGNGNNLDPAAELLLYL